MLTLALTEKSQEHLKDSFKILLSMNFNIRSKKESLLTLFQFSSLMKGCTLVLREILSYFILLSRASLLKPN